VYFRPHQVGRFGEKSLGIIVHTYRFDSQILAYAETRFFQLIEECRIASCNDRIVKWGLQHSNPSGPDGKLLRLCRERPRSRAAEKGDELAPPHVAPKLRRQHCIGSNEYFDRG